MFRVSDIDLASMDLPGRLPVWAPCSVLEAACPPASMPARVLLSAEVPLCDDPSELHCSLYACAHIALARQLHGRQEETLGGMEERDAARASSSLAALSQPPCLCAGEEMQRAQKHAQSSGLFFRVALVVVATGAYVDYVRLFALSASRLFIPDHEVWVARVWSFVH